VKLDSGTGGTTIDSSLDGAGWIDAISDSPTEVVDAAIADADAVAPDAPVETGPTYADEVLSDDPVLYWRLDEKVGPTAHDSTGNQNDGTFMGSIVYEKIGATGGNDAVELIGGHIDAGNILDFPGLDPFTIEAWVKWNGGTIDYARIFSKETALADRNGWDLLLSDTSNPHIIFERWVSGTSDSLSVLKTLPTNAFAHVVASFDGQNMKLYVDGEDLGSKASTLALPDTASSLKIGAYTDTSNPFHGSIDEVAIYLKPLPLTRIKAHYDRALSGG